MLTIKCFLVRAVVLSSLLLCATFAISAQTPTPTPRTNPSQRDATKPPGQERNPSIPEGAQPANQNPQAPPGTQQTSPQAPPGTQQTAPQTPPGTPTATPPPT